MNVIPYRCLPCRLKTVAQAASRAPIYRRFHSRQPCADSEQTSTEQNKQPSASTNPSKERTSTEPTLTEEYVTRQEYSELEQIHGRGDIDKPYVLQSLQRTTPKPAQPEVKVNPAYPEVLAERKRVHEARKAQVTSLARGLRPYTEREKKLLAMRYTPEQMEAIEAGEEAVNAEDMIEHGRLRGDAFRPQYVDDFATIRPLVDDPVTGQGKAKQKLPIPGGLSSQTADAEDPHLIRLCKQTGMTKDQIKKIRVKNLVSHRVSNQTRMGKIHSIYFLTIAGNGDGMVGIGEGKAVEDEDGRRQAMMNAIRNMKPIPRYEERTIYGEVEAKVGATVVQLSSRPPGFGNRCQSLVYELARAAGISDLAARTPRSRNKMNVVKAAFQALTNQRLPEDVALARGRKMVDVRGVYYGGNVY